MVVDLKVLIGIVDDDDPGTCQKLIWQKFFELAKVKRLFGERYC